MHVISGIGIPEYLELCLVLLRISPNEKESHLRDSETTEIISQTYDGCARASAFCINSDQNITKTENIEFNERYKSCSALNSNFCK